MGVRLTGFSTPVGGASWEYTSEYTSETRQLDTDGLSPRNKIKVFISSICGQTKYDQIRMELKKYIEATQLATVYLFEAENAATVSARMHYISELEDSDICVFLIDNKDGITQGVQNEIDVVKKNDIKALYYFCDENSTEKTILETSLTGARFAKSKTIHRFSELSESGAKGFIDDIVRVYHYYCKGRILEAEKIIEDERKAYLDAIEKYQMQTIPKITLNNVGRCSSYILKFALSHSHAFDEQGNTSEMDEWCLKFLGILFEGNSIRNFNTSMYLTELRKQQSEEYHNVVKIRWRAIEAYFVGDVKSCMEFLDQALQLARTTNQASWVIKDILIDSRNQHCIHCEETNRFSEAAAQKVLADSEDGLYYPVLDRIDQAINEKYIEDAYKEKIRSPHAVIVGGDVMQYGQMLASAFVVMMFNGSLTHIILFYDKLKNWLFHLSCLYDDWSCRFNLYKLAIFTGNQKELEGLRNAYPEVLNQLTSVEANEIMRFCANHPIKYKRIGCQCLAFGTIGYYLDDFTFSYYENVILTEIDNCIKNETLMLAVGSRVFDALSATSQRLSQDKISAVCCRFIERNYRRWYTDVFDFMSNHVKLYEMSHKSAEELVAKISSLFENENDRESIRRAPRFLAVLRKQDLELTKSWEQNVANYFSGYYEGDYKLIVSQNQDIAGKIQQCLKQIRKRNEEQGKNGVYCGYAVREIERIRLLLLDNIEFSDSEVIDESVLVVANTLLYSKESVQIKLDAIMLLIYIAVKYPVRYNENVHIYKNIVQQKESIKSGGSSVLSANIDTISLKIGAEFLCMSMGLNIRTEILQLMPHIRDDIATIRAVSHFIAEYLDISATVIFPEDVLSLILQNVLQWINLKNISVKCEATRILMLLLRDESSRALINQQLIRLIDSDGTTIKILIMRQINDSIGISESTKNYVLGKCKSDANFVVRKVHKEITQC